MVKMLAFDYIVNQIKCWYEEQGGDFVDNDLSKLKITKLLFFITAASTTFEDEGLLDQFDTFVAMPYGHVESYIQDNIEESTHFNITKQGLVYKQGIQDYQNGLVGHINLSSKIDEAITKLKLLNPGLVMYVPFQLVDLSHKWQSWKTVFSLAKRNGKYSMKIPKEMIMTEPKIFR